MTCAACAARIEKSLNRLEGVRANVNFAAETAQVAFPHGAVTVESSSTRSAVPATTPAFRTRARLPTTAPSATGC